MVTKNMFLILLALFLSMIVDWKGTANGSGLFQQEGEVCGPCYSLKTFNCGLCAEGLECVEDDRADLVPDLPSRCRFKPIFAKSIKRDEENEKINFKVMPSRSIEEPPSIQVTFVNGQQDYFELSHYKTNENVERGCNYLGHLRNDLSSNVAVTGCLFKPGDHLEITILSPSSVNKMFKVDYDQNAEIIKNPFEDGAESVYLQPDRREVAEWHRVLDEEISVSLEQKVEKTYQSNPSIAIGTMPEKMKATIWFGYEDGMKSALGNRDFDAWIQSVLTHTQAHYRHKESLGTMIEFEVAGKAMHKQGVTWYADDNIWQAETASMSAYNSGKIADTYSWWCNSGGGPTAGIAFRGTLCATTGSNTNLNEMQDTVAASGFVLSHELGHNFGMHHDFSKYHGGDGTPGTGPCDGKGIMSYGSKEHYQWSDCSRSDFHLHYWALKWGNDCLEDISDSCNDGDANATDTWGDSCEWYGKMPDACGKYDDDDFFAMSMCCVCKAQGFQQIWGNWAAWSHCSATCGGGSQERSRTCVKTPVFADDCAGPKLESKTCGNMPCDINLWPREGENKYCTGHQLANQNVVENQKSCQNQCELMDDCVGITYSNLPGNSRYCYICFDDELKDASNGFSFYRRQVQENDEVDGNWADWGQWSSCSRSCGKGSRIRRRTCTSPAPSETGKNCVGLASQTKSCNDRTCPNLSCIDKYPKNYLCKKTITCSKLAKQKKCMKSFRAALPSKCEKKVSSKELNKRVNVYCKKSCKSC